MALSDERVFYFLEEAFDLLGRHLYASQWDGREITARPIAAPTNVDEQRAELTAGIAELDGVIHALNEQRSKCVDSAEMEAISAKRSEEEEERQRLTLAIGKLPYFDDHDRRRLEIWQRRTTAHETLLDAFRAGHLKAWSARGLEMTLIDPELWRREHRGFACYLDLSLVVLPRTWSGQRRGVVKIRIQDFQNWLASVLPVAVEAVGTLSKEDRARIWLQDFVRENAHRVVLKREVHEAMDKAVGDPGKRAFKRLWETHVPAAWRKRGRRHGT